jgi:starch phosphorylase
MVRVELYADAAPGGVPVRQEMVRGQVVAAGAGGCSYRATVPAAREAHDYTPRIIPEFAGVSVPLEAGWILWQK